MKPRLAQNDILYAKIRSVVSLPCSGGRLLLVTALLGDYTIQIQYNLAVFVKFFVAAYLFGGGTV